MFKSRHVANMRECARHRNRCTQRQELPDTIACPAHCWMTARGSPQQLLPCCAGQVLSLPEPTHTHTHTRSSPSHCSSRGTRFHCKGLPTACSPVGRKLLWVRFGVAVHSLDTHNAVQYTSIHQTLPPSLTKALWGADQLLSRDPSAAQVASAEHNRKTQCSSCLLFTALPDTAPGVAKTLNMMHSEASQAN